MSSVGLSGSSPFGLSADTPNVLLMNAVQAKWTTDISNPVVTDVMFLPTWFQDASDITLAFRHIDEVRPVLDRTVDGRYEKVHDMVDIHIWVRGTEVDYEPVDLIKVINALKTILHKYKGNLIANCICQVTAILPGRLDEEDDRQTLWHRIMRVQISHYEVSTV